MSKTSQQKRSIYQLGYEDGTRIRKLLCSNMLDFELMRDDEKREVYRDYRRYSRHPFIGIYKKGFKEGFNLEPKNFTI